LFPLRYGSAWLAGHGQFGPVVSGQNDEIRKRTLANGKGVFVALGLKELVRADWGGFKSSETGNRRGLGKGRAFALGQGNRIASAVDGRGRTVIQNNYDFDGRVASQWLQGDPTKAYTFFYGGDRNISIDPLVGATTYLYDPRGRCVGIIDANGNQSATVYDGEDHAIEIATPRNNGAIYSPGKFTYDQNQNVTLVQEPLRSPTDALPNSASRIYDSQNRLWKEYDFKGYFTERLYNSHNQIQTLKDRKGATVESFAYNVDGYLQSITDAALKVTTYSDYDAYGNACTITYPSIAIGGATVVPTEHFIFNERGDQISHTDRNSNTTTGTFNQRRQPLIVTLPAVGGVTTTQEFQYDDAGNLYRAKDSRGYWTQTESDASGNLVTSTQPATPAGIAVLRRQYDARNWLSAFFDAGGRKTSYTYDPAGHVSSISDPLSRTTLKFYNADGLVTEVRDPRSESCLYAYNLRGELYQTTDALTHVSKSVPDANGRIATTVNKRLKSFTFGYDENGKITTLKTPLLKTTTTAWNSLGLIAAIDEPSGDRSEFTYDGMQRASQVIFKHGGSAVSTVGYEYDGQGSPKKISETASGSTRTVNFNTYDARNRLTSFTDAAGNIFGYQYDANGNLAVLTYPSDASYPTGRQVSYTYDALNHLQSVTDWAGRVTRYYYDISGRLLRTIRPNGTVRRLTWTDAGELKGYSEVDSAGAPILWLVSDYDDSGRETNETCFPAPHSYTAPGFAATYDDDNRLSSFNGSTVTCDADANMIQGPLGASSTSTFTYDSRNRLTNAGGLTYDYDPTGARIGVISSAGLTKWSIDPNASLALVREKPDGTKTWYVYGIGLLYEVSDSEATTTYHCDSRGSSRALTADDGATVTARFEYDAFGRETWSAGTITTPFRFGGAHGVQTDDNGLCFMRARFYSPQIRRFLNADPSGFKGGSNWFAYANGNPISLVDPFGLSSHDLQHSYSGLIFSDPNDISGPQPMIENSTPYTYLNNVKYDISNQTTTFEYAVDWDLKHSGMHDMTFDLQAMASIPGLARGLVEGGGYLLARGIARFGTEAAEVSQPFAMGLTDEGLEAFAQARGATTWKQLPNPEQWQAGVIDKLADPLTPVHFNLDGVDVWGGVTRAAVGRGGPTDWELMTIRQSPQYWDSLQFWKAGEQVANPFK